MCAMPIARTTFLKCISQNTERTISIQESQNFTNFVSEARTKMIYRTVMDWNALSLNLFVLARKVFSQLRERERKNKKGGERQ